jgi:hypothetical protein
VINLTESSHGKFSYTLKPGQHRYIYKDSDVNFGDALKTNVGELKRQVQAMAHDPMDARIVREIIKRAKTHPAFPPILRKLLPP